MITFIKKTTGLGLILSILMSLIFIGNVMSKSPLNLNKPTDFKNETDNLIVEKVIVKMIAYYGKDLRRTHHALKVHDFAKTLGKLEGLSEKEQLTLEVAAVLHDIGIPESERKYNSSAAKYQELEGPPIARELLTNIALDKEIVDRVCFMVGNHHTYDKVDNKDFQILFEADFLVNMYEGKAKKERIEKVQKRLFKTKSGNDIINSMMNE